MAIPRTYATAGAFRRALEERLKSMSQTEQIDINRLRRQTSLGGARAFVQPIFGTAGSGSPASPFLTRPAKKAANGAISSRTLALSRASM